MTDGIKLDYKLGLHDIEKPFVDEFFGNSHIRHMMELREQALRNKLLSLGWSPSVTDLRWRDILHLFLLKMRIVK